MKLATIFLALFLLSGCGTEGVDMYENKRDTGVDMYE